MKSNLKKNIESKKLFNKTDKNLENQRNTKNIQQEPNKVDFKSDQILTNQGHRHGGNHAMINDLSIHALQFLLKNTILSK